MKVQKHFSVSNKCGIFQVASFLLLFFFFQATVVQSQAYSEKELQAYCIENKVDTASILWELASLTPSPCDSTVLILITPEIVAQEYDEYYALDSRIYLIKSKKIIAKFYESNATNEWTWDAIKLESIQVDTACLRFNTIESGFSLSTTHEGSSRVNPYNYTLCSYFLIKKQSIGKITHNYCTSTFSGEWDGNCVGEFTESVKKTSMDSFQTNGFYDFTSRILTTKHTNVLVDGECIFQNHESESLETLKFNGTKYVTVKK